MVALEDMQLSIQFKTANEAQSLSSSSMQMQSLSLQEGDVFLWRTDGMISSIHAKTSTTASTATTNVLSMMYCTMQPATCTPDATLSMKVEYYRQRQTTTYRLDVEEWIHPSSKAARMIHPDSNKYK
jgi:hypothetical protein